MTIAPNQVKIQMKRLQENASENGHLVNDGVDDMPINILSQFL